MNRKFFVVLTLLKAIILVILLHGLSTAQIQPDEVGFGFGGYVSSLRQGNGYQNCDFGFDPCATYARMPVLPWLLTFGFHLPGGLITLVLTKTLVFSASVFFLFRSVWFGLSWYEKLLFTLLFLNPLILKHLATPHYEEFLLGELLPIWAVSCVLFFKTRKPYSAFLAVLLACLLYLTKQTLLPLCAFTAVFAVFLLKSWKLRFLLSFLPVLTVVGWGSWLQSNGSESLMGTSYDGSNFLKAVAPVGYAIYPEVSVDKIFQTDHFLSTSGIVVNHDRDSLMAIPPSGFLNENDWDQHYRARAWETIRQDPELQLKYTAKKLWFALFGIHGQLREPTDSFNRGVVWWIFLSYKVIFAILILTMCFLVPLRMGGFLLSLYLLLLLPHVLGWGYERHITVLQASIGLACLFVVGTVRTRHQDTSRRDNLTTCVGTRPSA